MDPAVTPSFNDWKSATPYYQGCDEIFMHLHADCLPSPMVAPYQRGVGAAVAPTPFHGGNTAAEIPTRTCVPEKVELDEITVGAGKLLIKEGDAAGDAFLITGGRVEVFRAVNGTKHRLAVLGPGDVAGEMGLIDNSRRSACIATMEPTRLVIISRDMFIRQLRQSPPLVRYVLLSLVRTLRALNGIPTEPGDPIFAEEPIVSERTHKLLRRETFAPDRVIFRRGDEAHCAYLIQSGRVEVWNETPDNQVMPLAQVGPGMVFGEMGLLRDANRAASVTALELTVCEIIHRHRFDELVRAAPPLIRQLLHTYVSRIEKGL